MSLISLLNSFIWTTPALFHPHAFKAQFCSRDFVLPVPSSWKCLPQIFTCLTPSHNSNVTSSERPFLTTSAKEPPAPLLSITFPCFIFFTAFNSKWINSINPFACLLFKLSHCNISSLRKWLWIFHLCVTKYLAYSSYLVNIYWLINSRTLWESFNSNPP